MAYRVNFSGKGWTHADEFNPDGIRVRGSGYVTVEGERPKTNFGIPFEAVKRCKEVFMEECHCERFEGDDPKRGIQAFPTVWLAKEIKPKKKSK